VARDAMQRLGLAHRHYGCRRTAVQLRRKGFVPNRKRVLCPMRVDNLACRRMRPVVPIKTDSRQRISGTKPRSIRPAQAALDARVVDPEISAVLVAVDDSKSAAAFVIVQHVAAIHPPLRS